MLVTIPARRQEPRNRISILLEGTHRSLLRQIGEGMSAVDTRGVLEKHKLIAILAMEDLH
jgi:hypothetical protein